MVVAGIGVAVDRLGSSRETQASRPDLQRVLDSLVRGPVRLAPGVTAYVSAPTGTWLGSAGVANVQTGEPMRPDARMRLESTAYDPQGPIAGPHAKGYNIAQGGKLTDATAWHAGKGADGALVSNADDEATFLKAMMDGTLGIRQQVLAFFGTGNEQGCPGSAYLGEGAGQAYRTYAYYDHTGSRVAVLMLNGFHESSSYVGEPRALLAVGRLFCSA